MENGDGEGVKERSMDVALRDGGLVAQIVQCLDCDMDRHAAALVCRVWNEAVVPNLSGAARAALLAHHGPGPVAVHEPAGGSGPAGGRRGVPAAAGVADRPHRSGAAEPDGGRRGGFRRAVCGLEPGAIVVPAVAS
jgi:hypothetical protein